MVPSRYNINIPYGDKYIFTNTLTGALDLVDSSLSQHILDPKCEDLCEETEFLKGRGYLVENLALEDQLISQIYPELLALERNKRSVKAVLIMSFACNLHCTYCWQQHQVDHNSNMRMTIEQLDAAMDAACLLTKYLADTDSAPPSFHLFGGEPLTRENYYLVSHALERAQKMNSPVSITSNGRELKYYLQLFETYPVNELQITIDGDEETHNSRRLGSRWKDILDGINELLYHTDITVKVRVNLDEELLDRLLPLANIIVDRLWWATKRFYAYLAPLRDSSMNDVSILRKRVLVLRRFLELREEYPQLELFRLHGWDCFHVSEYLQKTNRFPLPKPYFCEVNTGQVVFDPDGSMHLCSEEIHSDWDILGTYYPGFSVDMNIVDNIYNCQPISNERCKTCDLLPVCGGGCVQFSRYPDYQKQFCQTAHETYELAIKYYIEDNINNQ